LLSGILKSFHAYRPVRPDSSKTPESTLGERVRRGFGSDCPFKSKQARLARRSGDRSPGLKVHQK
jgi:hypothetical protein